MARLTDTQLVVLSAASQREDRGVELPANVQGKAAGKIVDKLIRAGLLEEVGASGSLPVWRRDDDNGAIALRITSAGLAAIAAADEVMVTPEENGGRLSSTGEGIASCKQTSVSAQRSARKRHRPGKGKTQTGSLHDSPPGSKQLACSRCWADQKERPLLPSCGRPIGSNIRCVAFSPVWCARSSARSSLGEGRR